MDTCFNLGHIHEAIAEAVPDRECLVFRDRRFTWSQLTDRTRRLAAVLPRPRSRLPRASAAALQSWESGQDHVALYLYNGNEYLEGMLGAYKARARPSTSTTATSRRSCSISSTTRTRGPSSTTPASRRRSRTSASVCRRSGSGSRWPTNRARRCCPAPSTTRRRSPAAKPGAAARISRPTISTSSTPAARRACRRACCGGRRTSSAPRCRACSRSAQRRGDRRAGEGTRRSARCPRRPSCTARRTGWRSTSGTSAAPSWCSRSRAISIPTTSGPRSSASR